MQNVAWRGRVRHRDVRTRIGIAGNGRRTDSSGRLSNRTAPAARDGIESGKTELATSDEVIDEVDRAVEIAEEHQGVHVERINSDALSGRQRRRLSDAGLQSVAVRGYFE